MKQKLLLNRSKVYLIVLLMLFAVPLFAQNNSGMLNFNQKQLSVSAIVTQLKKDGYKVSFDADVDMAKMISLPSTTISLDNLTNVLRQQAAVGLKNIDGNLVVKKTRPGIC